MSKTARCSCGQLQVVCSGEPVRISVCHCPACQRRTGSVFGTQARYPDSAIQVQGTFSTWTRHTDDDDQVLFRFCPVCASTMFWNVKSLADFTMIGVGFFADPAFPPPRVSVWEDMKHAWVRLPEDIEHLA